MEIAASPEVTRVDPRAIFEAAIRSIILFVPQSPPVFPLLKRLVERFAHHFSFANHSRP